MAPGLLEDVFKPFSEVRAFPLKTLIDYRPHAVLTTYRGRCVSLDVFGQDVTSGCEGRAAVSFTGDVTTIQWFTLGAKAIGLETIPPLDPPQNGVLRYTIGKVHVLSQGHVSTEAASGSCSVDAYYIRCETMGRSGRIAVNFATLGGPSTRHYTIEDAVFRIPRSEVSTARGQCLTLARPDDATPYCASFVGRAVLDKRALTTFFTLDARTVLGFYGLLRDGITEADGSYRLPITSVLLIQGDTKAGTTPVDGLCKSRDQGGHTSLSCHVTTVREGATIEAAFQTTDPWGDAVRLDRD